MADEKKLELTFKWKNRAYFELKAKPDDGENFIVIRADENHTIATIWTHLEGAVKNFIAFQMDKIHKEMLEP